MKSNLVCIFFKSFINFVIYNSHIYISNYLNNNAASNPKLITRIREALIKRPTLSNFPTLLQKAVKSVEWINWLNKSLMIVAHRKLKNASTEANIKNLTLGSNIPEMLATTRYIRSQQLEESTVSLFSGLLESHLYLSYQCKRR